MLRHLKAVPHTPIDERVEQAAATRFCVAFVDANHHVDAAVPSGLAQPGGGWAGDADVLVQ